MPNRPIALFPALLTTLVSACAPATGSQSYRAQQPDCEWCGAQDAPPRESLSHVLTIAGPDEPGERMVLRGRVFHSDGETPAPGVLMYAYHTDATGVYRPGANATGNARRHGELRGWLITGPRGEYEIRTTRPGGYPGRSDPQHVHITFQPQGEPEQWVESTLFANDPRITDAERRESERAGRFGNVVQLTQGGNGALLGERDIRLRP